MIDASTLINHKSTSTKLYSFFKKLLWQQLLERSMFFNKDVVIIKSYGQKRSKVDSIKLKLSQNQEK